MSRKKIIFFNIFHCYQIFVQAQDNLTSAQMLDVFQSRAQDAARVANVFFNPVRGTPQQPIPNPYPTNSINEAAVDQTFAQGMKIDKDIVRYIKNFYFYVDYVVKIEVAAKIAAYARTQNIDVTTVLGAQSWTDLIKQASQKAGGYNQLKQKSFPLAPNFEDVKLSFSSTGWQDILKTAFWQSIQINSDDIINSSLWQDYTKYIIAKTFTQDGLLLPNIYRVEESIFRYLPNFEISYYQEDFTQLRNSSEYFRLHLVLADEIRAHFLAQSLDWKQFIDRATGEPDLVTVYNAAEKFKATDFYKFVSLAETPNANDLMDMIANKKIPIDPKYAQQPLVQEKFLCISMIKNLQALTNYLYQTENLENTMRVLANPAIQKPNPNFLFYRPDDYIYLEDLANVVDSFKTQAQKLAAGQDPHEAAIRSLTPARTTKVARASKKVVVQGLADWLSDTWSDISSSQIGKDISTLVNDTVTALGDEAAALGYTLVGGVLTAIDPKKSDELLKKSRDLQAKINDEFSKAIVDAGNTVKDAETLAKQGVSDLAKSLDNVLSNIDPQLADAISGQVESILDFAITFIAGATEAAVTVAGGVMQFTADAVNTLGNIVVDVTFKGGDWSQLGEDVLNGVKLLSYDFVTTILSSISLVATTFVEQLTNIVKFLGYGISMITDLFVDVVKGVMGKVSAVLDFFGLQAAGNAAQVVGDWLDNHRRLIDTVVTTGLMLGAIVLTDGAAAPLLIMTLGPQLFQGIGSYQSDELAKARKVEQAKFVANFQKYVDNNETIAQQTQDAWKDELNGKFNAQISNQERELGFYENFLRSYIENMKNQFGIFGGNYIRQQMTTIPDRIPDTMIGDVGAIYGFKTNVLNLNPSQGFPLYSAGRNSFSQEIAEFPALAIQTSPDQFIKSTTPRVFWFNQKETVQLENAITEVEIKFKPIYTLNMFYVGIYVGGKSINFDQVRKEGTIDIDTAHLAKMFVYKKENKDDPIALSIYEHEGAGWLQQKINGPEFAIGNWYRMNVKLDGTTLQVKIWQEGQREPSAQTITVTKSPEQKTFGVISAGASIEYQIIKPKVPDPVGQSSTGKTGPAGPLRQTLPSEAQRERDAKIQLDKNLHPNFGTFNLQPLSTMSIVRGKYIYRAKAQDPHIVLGTDYFVFGCQAMNGQLNITEIGRAPGDPCPTVGGRELEKAIVSLVTNKAYNKEKQHITTCQNVYDVYLKVHGPLPDNDAILIDSSRKQYISTLLVPFNFGGLGLQATSGQELINGQYIYWGISPDPLLRGEKNTPAKDQNNKPIFDYFAMVVNDAIGAPYDPTIATIRSFVTGTEYSKTGQAGPNKYQTDSMLQEFEDTFGPLRPELRNEIIAAQKYYITKTTTQGTTPSKTTPNQQVKSGDTSATTGYTGTDPLSTGKAPVGQTPDSLNQQTQEASADEFSFGGS